MRFHEPIQVLFFLFRGRACRRWTLTAGLSDKARAARCPRDPMAQRLRHDPKTGVLFG
jgi:hypothetical protein